LVFHSSWFDLSQPPISRRLPRGGGKRGAVRSGCHHSDPAQGALNVLTEMKQGHEHIKYFHLGQIDAVLEAKQLHLPVLSLQSE